MARQRRGRRRSLEARVERAGNAALTTAWSACVRAIAALLRAVLGLPRAAQVVLTAALLLSGLALAHFAADDDALYLDDDAEALARVIRSECGICTRHEQLHVAWATRNLARHRGQTIAEMACSPCGEQERGRPVSSRQPATDSDRALARYVLAAPPLADPTGGARHFINPRLQDELAAAGDRPGYRNNPYRVVRRRWIESYGWAPYYRLGPHLELWGPPRKRGR